MKLTVTKNLRQSSVTDENGEKTAVIKNSLLSYSKTVVNLKDNETIHTDFVNSEDCYVFDNEKNEIAYGKIKAPEKDDFKNSFFDNPDKVTIEFGEDAYTISKIKGDDLKITKCETDADFFSEVAYVRDISKMKSVIESEIEMSSTTLIVIYIFSKYLYDSKLIQMV